MFIDCLPVQRVQSYQDCNWTGGSLPSAYRSIPDLLQQNVPVEYLLVYTPDPIGMFQIDVDAKGHSHLSRVLI